jgi:hypothetical protein
VTTCPPRDGASPLLHNGVKSPGCHAEETSEVPLHLDTGGQRAVLVDNAIPTMC